MMANAELAEAERAEGVFTLLHRRKRFAGNGAAVFDARGKTGRGGLVPDAKAGALRQGADVLLRQACVEERRDNVVLAGGLLSGAEVSLVIDIYAVSDRGEGA